MSEKEEEKVILEHFYHEHPLILTQARNPYEKCYGCTRFIFSGETAYACSRDDCGDPIILDEACAEMPREIRLSSHPQHTLIQKEVMYNPTCAVCDFGIWRIGYYCSSSCKFQIHVGCAWRRDVIRAAAAGIKHSSHPQHELMLLCRAGRLRCDACGTRHKGKSYICLICQYCINESCAALTATKDFHHLHHHPLTLVFNLPQEYIKFHFKCHICFKDLSPLYWAYHCGICRYVVHINCAIRASPLTTSNIDANAADDGDVITFPTEELIIRAFVKKLGVMVIPHENYEMVKGEYKFHNPDHQLCLISSSLHDQEEKEEEEEDEDEDEDDDDDLNYGRKSELVCDGCTMTIFDKKQKETSNKYISCGECKYFLHLGCFQLPAELPSHPLHSQPDHILTLQMRPKLDFIYCDICGVYTNGLFYGCTKCYFEADIKCASLPDTIKHKAHPHHRLKLLTQEITSDTSYRRSACSACGYDTYRDVCYTCDICQIILHSKCVLLPEVVTNPTWDKHPLPLTFDPSENHPSSFYCEVCEQEMNPKSWMYHCRDCDVSVHPKCFPTMSGEYRNIKFGQRYLVPAVHNHTLAHQLLTKKLHCDVCGERKEYGTLGFQCCSDKCEFFMCFKPCGEDRKDAMHAVD